MKLASKIYRRYWQFRQLFLTNPLKISEAWRKRASMQIGKGTYIYRDVKFGRGGADPIKIGANCVLTGCTILGHDASTNRALNIPPGKPSMRRQVIIEDECFIGYGAIILMGVTIGRGSVVGAGAIVTQNVPPNSVVAGNPARIVCTVEELVEKRRQLALANPEYIPQTHNSQNE